MAEPDAGPGPGEPAAVYPVALLVAGRPCLVVGGGRVATRKVAGLLGCGARVTVVAPDVSGELALLVEAAGRGDVGRGGSLTVDARPYEPGEAARYRLVVTATGVAGVDRRVAGDAERAGVWVNSADDPDHCTFLLPAVHRDGPVTVAVSTGGASPALAAWLRTRIAEAAGPGLGVLATLLGEARRRLRASGRSGESVDWTSVLDGRVVPLVRAGRVEEARDALRTLPARPAPGPGPQRSRAEATGHT